MSRAEISLPQAPAGLPTPRALGQTSREDLWWVQPLAVFLGLGAFIVYSTWAALQGAHYFVAGTEYLSPMYSPTLWDAPGQHSGHAWLGPWPSWLSWVPVAVASPAFLILWAPAGFRFTCYYYRGAYYKAFWADPLTCAVGEPGFRGKRFRGERSLPLILQNVHRYFYYLAALFIVLLSIDAVKSYWFTDIAGKGHFGIGVGSLVLTINPILLGAYTFGCHSLRHLIGGKKDCLSSLGPKKRAYDCVSCLNRNHMKWAWFSLFWVGFTDFYVRMVSMGYITDYRLL
jgi:hypothetical protein